VVVDVPGSGVQPTFPTPPNPTNPEPIKTASRAIVVVENFRVSMLISMGLWPSVHPPPSFVKQPPARSLPLTKAPRQ
jgi:hypothetical protein